VSVCLTAGIEEGVWRDPRIVLGAVSARPWRARATERWLDGRPVRAHELAERLEHELEHRAHPLTGNGWKVDAAVGLTRRAAARILS
jgi:xanthine dehydrogenase YagS FAD-binding subunit